jgi:hypothetical protein
VASIYTQWQDFFDSTAKHEYLYNKGTQDGFFSASVSETAKGHTKKDIKEYGFAKSLLEKQGPTLWS